MHGIEGEGTATTRAGLAALGVLPSADADAAARRLDQGGLAYLPLEALLPGLAGLFDLRPSLGLRTPVHTLARELNPLNATAQIQGVFHPTYLELHQETQHRLGQGRAVTFKGGGGEGQRNPDKPCRALWVEDGARFETILPAIAYGSEPWPWRREALEPARLAGLWHGEWTASGPVAAVTGTTALCLRLLGRAADAKEAQGLAEAMWQERRLERAA